MSISLGFIHGVGLGFEFIAKDEEDEIDESVLIIDFLILRCFFWFGDNNDK